MQNFLFNLDSGIKGASYIFLNKIKKNGYIKYIIPLAYVRASSPESRFYAKIVHIFPSSFICLLVLCAKGKIFEDLEACYKPTDKCQYPI